MKYSATTIILLTSVLLIVSLTGCQQTRLFTEKYIKYNIESHQEGEFSTIRTYTIFKGANSSSYLELTGYKYAGKKALIIGADKYYAARKSYKGDNTVIADITYIELSVSQCMDIISNYKILQKKIKDEKVKINEEVYHDFTVSTDLFISYKKTKGALSVDTVYFWINGERYPISTNIIINKIEEFIDW